MDHLSAWINNRQLLDRINPEELLSLQNMIIENVFGGFNKLLLNLMRNHKQLSLEQHLKLYNALLTKHNDDIYDNYKANYQDKNKLCIFSISDDCLIYIMKFLRDNDIYSVQQTSRLFATISRNESVFFEEPSIWTSVSHRCIEYNITPNKQSIINGLLSDDNGVSQQQSMTNIAEMIEHGDHNCYVDIKNYSNRLQQYILNEIATDLNNTDYLTIFQYELQNNPNKHLLSILSEILGKKLSGTYENKFPNIMPNSKLIKIFKILSSICKRYIFDIMSNKELISNIISILCNHSKYKPKPKPKIQSHSRDPFGSSDSDDDFGFVPRTYNTDILPIGLEILNKILNCRYEIHKHILFQNGIVDLFIECFESNYDKYTFAGILTQLMANISTENIDIIITHDKGLNITLSLIKKHTINSIISIFKSSNYEQREILINHMTDTQFFGDLNKIRRNQYSVINEIKNMLQKDNQLLLHTIFKDAFPEEKMRILPKKKLDMFGDSDDSEDDALFVSCIQPKPNPRHLFFDDSDDDEDNYVRSNLTKKNIKIDPTKLLPLRHKEQTQDNRKSDPFATSSEDDDESKEEFAKWIKLLSEQVPECVVRSRMMHDSKSDTFIDTVIQMHKDSVVNNPVGIHKSAGSFKDMFGDTDSDEGTFEMDIKAKTLSSDIEKVRGKDLFDSDSDDPFASSSKLESGTNKDNTDGIDGMAKADSIILSSLRDIGCDIDKDIDSFSNGWNAKLLMLVMVKCLKKIDGGKYKDLSEEIPDHTSHRYRLATKVADVVKELKYRENIIFSDILYPQEKCTRSILRFLVSKFQK